MKTKLIPALLAAATLTSAIAQSGQSGVPKANNTSSSSGSTSSANGGARSGASGLAGQTSYGVTSSARYGTRLNTIVRRGNTAGSAGSIILTSALPPEKLDELAEDLNVLNFMFNRTLGDKNPIEYRLGVPITFRDGRPVETTYIQDFGVLVKIFVPYPLVQPEETDKKDQVAAPADSEWEKARRALHAGDPAPGGEMGIEAGQRPVYNEELVKELKKQIFETLKNAANLRHVGADQSILVVVLGGTNSQTPNIDPTTGIPVQPENARSTVMSIRIRKADADAAMKSTKSSDELEKNAAITTYFDIAQSSRTPTAGFGPATSMFGRDYGYEVRPSAR